MTGFLDTLAAELRAVRTRRYRSVERLERETWRGHPSKKTLDMSDYGGVDERGKKIAFTRAQMLSGMRRQGLWGWINPKGLIRYWHDGRRSLPQLCHFFAHELAHHLEKCNPGRGIARDELLAEKQGIIAAHAARLALRVVKQ